MDKSRRVLFHLEKEMLPIDEMQVCISEFFGFVQSASEDCLSDVKWLAEIQRGSVALATYPYSDTETDEEIDQCLSTMRKDLKIIQGGGCPEAFGTKTMQHYGRMAKLFKSEGGLSGNPTILVDTPSHTDRTPIEMVDYSNPSVPAKVTHSFGTAYGEPKSFFTSGKPFFALYDEGTGRRMKVFYDDALLDVVRACYRTDYVRVTGDITFNEDGTKRSMMARDIQVLNRTKRTSLSDLFGILGDAE